MKRYIFFLMACFMVLLSLGVKAQTVMAPTCVADPAVLNSGQVIYTAPTGTTSYAWTYPANAIPIGSTTSQTLTLQWNTSNGIAPETITVVVDATVTQYYSQVVNALPTLAYTDFTAHPSAHTWTKYLCGMTQSYLVPIQLTGSNPVPADRRWDVTFTKKVNNGPAVPVTLVNVKNDGNWFLDTITPGTTGTITYIVTYVREYDIIGGGTLQPRCSQVYSDTLIISKNNAPTVAWVNTNTCYGSTYKPQVRLTGDYSNGGILTYQDGITLGNQYMTIAPMTFTGVDTIIDFTPFPTGIIADHIVDTIYTLLNIADSRCDTNISKAAQFKPELNPIPVSFTTNADPSGLCGSANINLTATIDNQAGNNPNGYAVNNGPWKFIIGHDLDPLWRDTITIPAGSLTGSKAVNLNYNFGTGMQWDTTITFTLLSLQTVPNVNKTTICTGDTTDFNALAANHPVVKIKRIPALVSIPASMKYCGPAVPNRDLVYTIDYPDSVLVKMQIQGVVVGSPNATVTTTDTTFWVVNSSTTNPQFTFDYIDPVGRARNTSYTLVSLTGAKGCINTLSSNNVVKDTVKLAPKVTFQRNGVSYDTIHVCYNDTLSTNGNQPDIFITSDVSTTAAPWDSLEVKYSIYDVTGGGRTQVGTQRTMTYRSYKIGGNVNGKAGAYPGFATTLNNAANPNYNFVWPKANQTYVYVIDQIRYVGIAPANAPSCTSLLTDSLVIENKAMAATIALDASSLNNFCEETIDSVTLSVDFRNSTLPISFRYITQAGANPATVSSPITLNTGTAGLTGADGNYTYTFKVKPTVPAGSDTITYIFDTTSTLVNSVKRTVNVFDKYCTFRQDSLSGAAKAVVHRKPIVEFINGDKYYICAPDTNVPNIPIRLGYNQPYKIWYNTDIGESVETVQDIYSDLGYLSLKMPYLRDTMVVRITKVQDAYCYTNLWENQHEVKATIYRLPPFTPNIVRIDGLPGDSLLACEGQRVGYTITKHDGVIQNFNWEVVRNGVIDGPADKDTVYVVWGSNDVDSTGIIRLNGVQRVINGTVCVNQNGAIEKQITIYDKPEAELVNVTTLNPMDTVCKGETVAIAINVTHPTVRAPYSVKFEEIYEDLDGMTTSVVYNAVEFFATDTTMTRLLDAAGTYSYVLHSIVDSLDKCPTLNINDTVKFYVLPDPQITGTINGSEWIDGHWFTCEEQYNDTIKLQLQANCRVGDRGLIRLTLADSNTVGLFGLHIMMGTEEYNLSAADLASLFVNDPATGSSVAYFNKGIILTGGIELSDFTLNMIPTSVSPTDTAVTMSIDIVSAADSTVWTNDFPLTRTINLTTTDAPVITSTFAQDVMVSQGMNVVSGCDTTYFSYDYQANCKRGVDGYLRFSVMSNVLRDSADFFYKLPGQTDFTKIVFDNTANGLASRRVRYEVRGDQTFSGGVIEMAVISKANNRYEFTNNFNGTFGIYFDRDSNVFPNNSFVYAQDVINVLTSTGEPVIAFTDPINNIFTPINSIVVAPCGEEDILATALPECKEGREARVSVTATNATGDLSDFQLFIDHNGTPMEIPLTNGVAVLDNALVTLEFPHIFKPFMIRNNSNITRQTVEQHIDLTVKLLDPADNVTEWASSTLNVTLVPVPTPFLTDTVATCRNITQYYVHPTVDNYINNDYVKNDYYKAKADTAYYHGNNVNFYVQFLDRDGLNVTSQITWRDPWAPEKSGIMINPTALTMGKSQDSTYYVPFYVFKQLCNTNSNITSDTVVLWVAINPVPKVTEVPVDPIYQNGQSVPTFVFGGTTEKVASNSGKTTYEWVRVSGDNIGLSIVNGVDSMPTFVATNTGSQALKATYRVTPKYLYKNSQNCDGLPVEFTITVLPSAGLIIPENQEVCNGTALNLTFSANAATKIDWRKVSGDDITGLPVNGTSITGAYGTWNGTVYNNTNKTRTATYRVKATFNQGTGTTADSSDFTITVRPAIAVTPINDIAACAGTDVPAFNFGTNADPSEDVTYSWRKVEGGNVGAGLNAANVSNFAGFTASSSPAVAKYAVKAYYNDAIKCESAEVFFNITVNTGATVTVTGLTAPVPACAGSTLSLNQPTVTGPAAEIDSAYWTLNGNYFAPNTILVRNIHNNGLLRYAVKTKCGVVSSAPVTITVNDLPTFGTITPTTITACNGGKIETPAIPAFDLNGGTLQNKGWVLNGNDFDPQTGTVSMADNGKTLSYKVTNSCGTTVSTACATITVNQAPVITITTPAAVCENTTLTLPTPSITLNGSTISSSSWVLGSNTITAPYTATYADNGKTLVYKATATCGIVESNGVIVTVNAKPVLGSIVAPVAVCEGKYINPVEPIVTDRGATVTSKGWKLANVAFYPETQTVTYADNGKSLVYEIVTTCGTSTTNPVAITVKGNPTVGTIAATSVSVCAGNKIVTPTVPVFDLKGGTLVNKGWTLNGNYFDPQTTDITIAANNAVLSYKVETECGTATSATSVTVVVNQAPVITITTPAAICENNTLTLPTPSIMLNGSTITTSSWVLGSNTIATPYTATYADNGKTLVYKATATCGTVESNGVIVTVNAKPVLGSIVAPVAVCSGGTISPAKPIITDRGATVTSDGWKLAGVAFYPETQAVTYADNGKSLVYEIVTTCGTSTTNPVAIVVNGAPTIGAFSTADIQVCNNTHITVPTAPGVTLNGSTLISQGWVLDGVIFNPLTTAVTLADNGKKLQYRVESTCGIVISTSEATIVVNQAPTVATITAPAQVTVGQTLTLTAPAVTANGSTVTAQGWLLGGQSFDPSTPMTADMDGKNLMYFATNGCGTNYSNIVKVSVRALSSDATIHAVVVNGTEYTFVNGLYNGKSEVTAALSCDPRTNTANIEVKTEAHATVKSSTVTFTNGSASHTGTLSVNDPGMYTVVVTVTPENGDQGAVKTYTIKLEQRFPKEVITVKPVGTTAASLVFNTNTSNGGYNVDPQSGKFQWYQSNSAINGAVSQTQGFANGLQKDVEYYVSATYNGEIVRSCPITGVTKTTAKIVTYPNPVKSAGTVWVTMTDANLTNAKVMVYDMRGLLYSTLPVNDGTTSVEINMPSASGSYVIRIAADGFEQNVKVVVVE